MRCCCRFWPRPTRPRRTSGCACSSSARCVRWSPASCVRRRPAPRWPRRPMSRTSAPSVRRPCWSGWPTCAPGATSSRSPASRRMSPSSAYNGWHRFLRERFPVRARLKNRLRYLCGHHPVAGPLDRCHRHARLWPGGLARRHAARRSAARAAAGEDSGEAVTRALGGSPKPTASRKPKWPRP